MIYEFYEGRGERVYISIKEAFRTPTDDAAELARQGSSRSGRPRFTHRGAGNRDAGGEVGGGPASREVGPRCVLAGCALPNLHPLVAMDFTDLHVRPSVRTPLADPRGAFSLPPRPVS